MNTIIFYPNPSKYVVMNHPAIVLLKLQAKFYHFVHSKSSVPIFSPNSVKKLKKHTLSICLDLVFTCGMTWGKYLKIPLASK